MYVFMEKLLKLIIWTAAASNIVTGLYFLDEPANVVVVLNKPYWWHCIAESTDTITYTWSKNTVEIVDDSVYTTFPNGTLYISSVTMADTGAPFMCTAIAEGTRIYSRQVTLQDAYIDEFSQNPVSQTAQVGARVTMNCEINSSPPAVIRWTNFANPVPDNMVTMVTSSKSQMTILSVDYQHAGQYYCIATNFLLPATVKYSQSAQLTVQGRPAFVQEPLQQSVPLGGTAIFHCVGVANPSHTLTWNRLDTDGNVVAITSDAQKYTVMENGTMKIAMVSESDAGFYTCVLSNEFGDNTKQVLLTVTALMTLPSFTSLSPDVTVMENETVTLECRATGKPLPTITWSKEFGPMPINRVIYPYPGVVTILGAKAEDQGIYVCTAENSQDLITHRTLLTVQVRPSVLVSPPEVIISPGGTVMLYCQASGEPRPTVQWSTPNSGLYMAPSIARDGIDVGSDGTLTIHNAFSKHHGKYGCMAHNKVSVVSAFTFVSVRGAPWFVKQPYNQGVIQGDGALLQCQAEGYPAPTVTWTKDGATSPITSDGKYQILPSGNLLIETTTLMDKGVYRCTASNTDGSVESMASLNILVPPTFTKVTADLLVQAGDNVWLDCVVTGDPEPDQWWEKGGSLLVIESNMVLYPNFTLAFTGIMKAQLDSYNCLAQNQAGSKVANVLIYTIDMPVIVTKPVNTTVNETGSVTILCTATADDTPTISWYSGAPSSSNLIKLGTDQDNRITVTDSGSLVITGIVITDMGWYTCQAENSNGKVNAAMYMHVQVPPKFVTTNSPQRIQRQTSVTLLCRGDGDPIPTTTWETPSGNKLFANTEGYIQERSDLIIQSAVEEEDGGTWTCVACNELGCASGNVDLIIEGKPIIRSIEASLNTTYTTLYCVPTGFPDAILMYYMDGQMVTPDLAGHSVQDNILAIELASRGSQYGCTAVNVYGEDTRNMSAPTSTVSNLQLGRLSATDAPLTWAAETSIGNLTVLSYNVYSKLESAADWSDASSVTTPAYTVTGLSPFTKYVFGVSVVTPLGEGPKSETDSTQTMESVPSSPVSLAATPTAEKSSQITWQPPQTPNADPSHLVYRLEMTNEVSGFQLSRDPPYTDTQLIMTSLPYGPYTVKLWTVNTLLNVESEPAVTQVNIKQTEPRDAPVITDIHPKSPQQIKITWNITQGMNINMIDGYIISIQVEGVDDDPIQIRVPVADSTHLFDNLKPATVYMIKVAAYNSGGSGPFSEIYTMVTPPAPEAQSDPEVQLALPWPYIVVITVCSFAFVCLFIAAVILVVKLRDERKKESVSLVKPRHLSERFYLKPNVEGQTNLDFSMY